MRVYRLAGTSLLTLAFLAACGDTQPTSPGSGSELARSGQTCTITDDAAAGVRTVSAGCLNSEVEVPEGWTLRVAGAVSAAPAAPTVIGPQQITPIDNPTPEYVEMTTLIDISGISDFTTLTSVSDADQTVTFSITMEKRSVPFSWGTWATPPFVEPGTPHILFTQGAQAVTMELSEAASTFGFELGPNPFAFHTFTAEFYSAGTLVGTLTREISGDNGARLMAATTQAGSFDRVVVTGTSDFSIGRIRYALGDPPEPPIEVEIDNIYSGPPPRAPGIISLEDDSVYVEILDIEQYLGRPASADDVRIGSSFAAGTPAASFQILDINGDSNLDIRLRWSLQQLVDDGHLSLQTQRLTVWGVDQSDEQRYRGIAEVEVIMGDVAIDQNQPSATVFMAAFDQGDLAQSFQTQQSDRPTAGAGIFLQPGVGGTDNVRISLWDALPNQPGANMLAQGQAQGTQGEWVDVFWSPVLLTANTTYYLVFDGNVSLGIAGDINNPYPHGHVFANPGFGPFPNFDYTFRTWISVEDGLGPTQVQGMRTSAPHGSPGLQRGGCAATARGC